MATILGAVLLKDCALLPAAKPKERRAKAAPVSKRPASSSPDSAAKRRLKRNGAQNTRSVAPVHEKQPRAM